MMSAAGQHLSNLLHLTPIVVLQAVQRLTIDSNLQLTTHVDCIVHQLTQLYNGNSFHYVVFSGEGLGQSVTGQSAPGQTAECAQPIGGLLECVRPNGRMCQTRRLSVSGQTTECITQPVK